MYWRNVKRGWSQPWSLANKLTFLYTTATVSILLIIVISAYWVVQQVVATAEQEYIIDEVNLIQSLLQQRPSNLSALKQEVNAVPVALKSAEYRYYVRIFDTRRRTFMQTPGMQTALPDPKFPAAHSTDWQSHVMRWHSRTGRHFISMTAPIQWNASGQPQLWMQMAFDGTYPEEIINQYWNKALFLLLLAILGVAALGRVITQKGLHRLYDMVQMTQQITVERLTERITTAHWPKELLSLGNAFNQMLERIEKAFLRISECTAELAHELRTPLNNLMLATEIALSRPRMIEDYQQVLASNQEEFRYLIALIENILFLARAQNQQIALKKVAIDLEKEIAELGEFYAIAAAEKQITLHTQATGLIYADLILFRRVLSNILMNAIQYTAPGGHIKLTTHVQGNHIEIQVSDNGMGIEAEQLPYIFDRFYQIKHANTAHPIGMGLGLALVKSIMDLHESSIRITSHLHQGTTVSLSFLRAV